jgi:excisionase family DNA binding protein
MATKESSVIRRSHKGLNPEAIFPSIDALAQELGVGRTAVYKGLRDGTIPAIKLGKRFVLPRAAIMKWLESAGAQKAAER